MSALPDYQFKAEDLIVSERVTKGKLEKLKEWANGNENLPEMPEEQLGLFLLVCEDDVDFAKNTILCYFKYQAQAPEFFSNKDVDHEFIEQTLKLTKFAVMPRRTKNNYTVGIAQLRDTYWYNYVLEPQIKVLFMTIDMMYLKSPPNGMIQIINLKDVGIMHLTKFKISTIKKFFHYIQEALPAQLRQVHILNTSYVLDKFMSMCKPFINKDLFNMIKRHPPNMPMEEFFAKYIEAECMPGDYGGLLPDLETLAQRTTEDMRRLTPFYKKCERQIESYKRLC